MPGTTIWKGNIHFGDIDLPVKLHTAVREERVQFHLLHQPDQARLHQQMICAFDKLPVPPEEQIKGFEVEEGKYVIVDPAELEKAAPESDRTIEIREFVKTAQLDPFLLDRVYYLEPDLAGSGYAAMVKALKEMDLAGICTWTMRKRTYLGALQVGGKVLRLSTLRHADELVTAGSLELQDVPVSDKELKVGIALIGQLTASFEPKKFQNGHQNKLQDMIQRKARGEQIAVTPPRRLKPTESDTLLETLEASLKKAA